MTSTVPNSILTVRQEELSETQMTVDGRLPDDLSGHIFLLAPIGHVDSKRDGALVFPSKDGTPLFNGNGMIYRLDFDKAGTVGLKSKIAKTPCYYADDATKPGSEYQEYGFRNFGLARLSPSLGVRSVANTALVPLKFADENERMLVTCDVGRPYEIDTHSLEVVTPIGWNKEWREQLPLDLPFEMVMNTAHPYFDAHTNEMFTVNYGKSLPTFLSIIFKSEVGKLSSAFKGIIERFAKLPEEKQNIKNLEIEREIPKELFNKESDESPERLKSFWQRLRELLKKEKEEQEQQQEEQGNPRELLSELKQLMKVVKQMLEGLHEFDDFVYLVRWDGKSEFERWEVKLPNGSPVKIRQTIHQIGVTQDYVVLMDTGFKVGPEQLITKPIIKNKKLQKLFREVLNEPVSSETHIYIVRRANLKAGERPAFGQNNVEVVAQHVVIPGGVIHFQVDYDNPQNQIVLHVAHSSAWDVSEWVREYDVTSVSTSNSNPPVGMMSGAADIQSLGRYVIDAQTGKLDDGLSKVISDRTLTWTLAINAYNEHTTSKKLDNIYWNSWGCSPDLLSDFIVDLYENSPNRNLSMDEVKKITKETRPANIFRLVTDSQEKMAIADSYQFQPGYFGSSIQFVPRTHNDGSSTDGYIACTVLSDKSEIWIFDAKNLTQGPLCKLSHPHLKFGFTTHTTWLPKIAPRTNSYYIPVREDYENLVKKQNREIQKLFEEAVYPKFPTVQAFVANSVTDASREKLTEPSFPDSATDANREELDNIKLNILESKLPDKKLPEGLHGHVFIMGPVGSINSGRLPYSNGDPIFNSDGMIYRLDFNHKGEVGLKTQITKPPCYYADKATQPGTKYAEYGFGNLGISRFSNHLGSRNQLNTAFVPIYGPEEGDRLLITCDAGRPYEIDTETLKVVTPVGTNKEWRPEIKLKFPFPPVLTTAHPAFDAHTREVFTVNYGRSLSNFLETIPSINELDKFLDEFDEFLEKGIFRTFSQISGKLRQLFSRFVSPLTDMIPQDFVYLIRWDGVGEFERWKLVLPDEADGTPVEISQSLHQIGITKDYVILIDTNFKVGIAQAFNNLFPSHQKVERLEKVERLTRKLLTLPVLPETILYIVRRRDLKDGQRPQVSQQEVKVVAQKIVIPQGTIHFALDYENPDNKITLHVTHNSADVAEWVRQHDNLASSPETSVASNLVGMLTTVTDVSRLGRYVIDGESGEILESNVLSHSKYTWGVGLYTYCDRLSTGLPSGQVENIYWQSAGFWQELFTKFIFDLYKDNQNRIVSPKKLIQANNRQNRPSCLFRLNTTDMKIADAYEFPVTFEDGKSNSHMILSPQFVPRADGDGSSTDGYIVCTVASEDGDEIWIFDANNLAQGPLCKLGHPSLNFSYTIHTVWLPKISPRTASYNCPVREDYQEQVKKNSQDIQDLFETKIYPYFEGKSAR